MSQLIISVKWWSNCFKPSLDSNKCNSFTWLPHIKWCLTDHLLEPKFTQLKNRSRAQVCILNATEGNWFRFFFDELTFFKYFSQKRRDWIFVSSSLKKWSIFRTHASFCTIFVQPKKWSRWIKSPLNDFDTKYCFKSFQIFLCNSCFSSVFNAFKFCFVNSFKSWYLFSFQS